jgi:hypothetical protein
VIKSGYATHIQEDLVVGLQERTVEVRLYEEGEVEVTVLDSDGEVVRGARVRRESVDDEEDSNSENTDGSGRVLFRKLAAGTHRFKLTSGETEFFMVEGRTEARETETEWKTVEVAAGAKARLTLVQPARSTVEVTVRSKGRLLGSIDAQLYRLPPGSDAAELEASIRKGQADSTDNEETDAAGRAEFTRVERGEYLLAVRADQVRVPTISRLEVDQPRETLTVELPFASVSGRVVDPSGRPLAGVRVSLSAVQGGNPGAGNRWRGQREYDEGTVVIDSPASTGSKPGETDAEGRFSIDSAPAGVELVAWANGSAILGAKSEPFQLGTDEQKSGIEIVASLAGNIAIELQQSGTTRPTLVSAEAVELLDDKEGQRSQNSAWGSRDLTLGPLTPGRWRVSVTAGSWRDENRPVIDTREITVRAGEIERYEVRLP